MGSRKNARQRRVEKRLGEKTRPFGGLVKTFPGCLWSLASLHHAMAPPTSVSNLDREHTSENGYWKRFKQKFEQRSEKIEKRKKEKDEK